jgi:hypothetical protein
LIGVTIDLRRSARDHLEKTPEVMIFSLPDMAAAIAQNTDPLANDVQI